MAFFGARKDIKAAGEKTAQDAKKKRGMFSGFRSKADLAKDKEPALDVTSTKVEKTVKKPKIAVVAGADYQVLLRPRITEKATLLADDSHVYVFDIRSDATKAEVARAVSDMYKVKPAKVNIVRVPEKRIASRKVRGSFGAKSGGKKAYVFLKKGETIDLV